jgi:hypothetical protein
MSSPSFPTWESDERESNAKLARTAGRSGGPEQPAENAEKLPGCGASGYLIRSRRRRSLCDATTGESSEGGGL